MKEKKSFIKLYRTSFGIATIIYILATIAITFICLFERHFFSACIAPLSLLAFAIPPLVERILRLLLGEPLKIFTLIFCTIAFQFGVVLDLYNRTVFFDKFAHFISGFLFTLVGFGLYAKMDPQFSGRTEKIALQCCFALFFSMFIACCWEICEFADYLVIGHDAQHHETSGVFDTMYDMIFCLLGSLLVLVDLKLSAKLKRRFPMAYILSHFDAANQFGTSNRSKNTEEKKIR